MGRGNCAPAVAHVFREHREQAAHEEVRDEFGRVVGLFEAASERGEAMPIRVCFASNLVRARMTAARL